MWVSHIVGARLPLKKKKKKKKNMHGDHRLSFRRNFHLSDVNGNIRILQITLNLEVKNVSVDFWFEMGPFNNTAVIERICLRMCGTYFRPEVTFKPGLRATDSSDSEVPGNPYYSLGPSERFGMVSSLKCPAKDVFRGGLLLKERIFSLWES